MQIAYYNACCTGSDHEILTGVLSCPFGQEFAGLFNTLRDTVIVKLFFKILLNFICFFLSGKVAVEKCKK